MDDLDKYVEKRKQQNPNFWESAEQEYETFKLNILLKQIRQESGISQQDLAEKIGTTKSVISRIENHAEDVRFSTIQKVATACGKKVTLSFS